ncbi:MAG: MMPL family transporter [Cellulomonadaceae bacterium]
MFDSLGRSIVRHPRGYLLVWIAITLGGILVALVGVTGQGLFDRMSTGEPEIHGSQSTEGEHLIRENNPAGESVTAIVSGVDPDSAEVATVLTQVNADVAAIPGVVSVIDPFILPDGVQNPAAAPLLGQSGDGFIVVADLDPTLSQDAEDTALSAVAHELGTITARLADTAPDATNLVGSNALIVDAITDQVKKDLTTGELIALPIALIVMVLVFGGFIAAALPMAAAVASIGAGLGALYALSFPLVIDVSAVNVITLISIGLSIDYGLLIVSRFREELHREEAAGADDRRRRRGSPVHDAVVRTLATAGRTVAFSALTVAISIAGLMVFSPDIIRAIGAAGVTIVLIAVATALTLVPALLVLLGARLGGQGSLHRVPGLSRLLARTADVSSDEGTFSRLAERVQRRPWWVLAGSLVLLVLLALPLGSMHLRNSGIGLLPASDPQRQFVATLAQEYPESASPDIQVVAAATLEEATAWAQELTTLDDVEAVTPPVPIGSYVLIGVDGTDPDPGGPGATALVRELRGLDPSFEVWVTGQAAGQVDFVDALSQRVGWAIGVVIVATFVLLFLMTGSVVVPVKALLTNIVSLAASLGVVTWAFQDGHLGWLLGIEATGGLETYVVAMVVAFAFGLAMDYEVFLLARIKELYDSGLDNDEAVRIGLQRSGRIITSAAAIIVVVFLGFVFGRLLVIKEVGFALAFAVLLDATLVRMLLVPATMTLLGRWNWWAPAPLRKVHEKLAITH